ncbi:MAG: NAD(P)H-hydrate epimerase [Phycisphaeraceae bacterium]|nr:NAD(P)H-hydrate epimerase [Phycisphaeraceae bacterium]
MARTEDSADSPRRRGMPGRMRRSDSQPFPTRVYSRSELREIDLACVRDYEIPSVLLMENAAIGLAGVAQLAARSADGFLVVCGRGNNGGDGLAAARHLHNAGREVAVLLLAPHEEYRGDAAIQLRVASRMGLDMVRGDAGPLAEAFGRFLNRLPRSGLVVIDAVLGTGLDRPVSGRLAEAIACVNALKRGGAIIVAADVPSGLDADTGRPLAEGERSDRAVQADITVTFVGWKRGFLTPEAQEFLGTVVVCGIGAPRELTERLGEPLDSPDRPGDEANPGRGSGNSRDGPRR